MPDEGHAFPPGWRRPRTSQEVRDDEERAAIERANGRAEQTERHAAITETREPVELAPTSPVPPVIPEALPPGAFANRNTGKVCPSCDPKSPRFNLPHYVGSKIQPGHTNNPGQGRKTGSQNEATKRAQEILKKAAPKAARKAVANLDHPNAWIQAGAVNTVLDRTVPKKIEQEGEAGDMIVLPPGSRMAIAVETPPQRVIDAEARVIPGAQLPEGDPADREGW